MMYRFLFIAFVYTPMAYAEIEMPYDENREERYEDFFDNVLVPFWKKGSNAFVKSHDGKDLVYRVYPSDSAAGDTKGNVLIVHGFTEMMPKYIETVWDLHKAGYTVYIFEQRGHGYSYRETAIPGLAHVQEFDSYVKDVEAVATQLFDSSVPNFYLGHSMGALVSLGHLYSYSGLFQGAFLSSPLVDTKYPVPKWLANPFVNAWCFIQGEENFAPLQKRPPPVPYKYNKRSGTNSLPRFHKVENLLVEEGYDQERRVQGASCAWVKTIGQFQDIIRTKEAIAKIKVPIIIAQAGQDFYVMPEAQAAFCKEHYNCKLLRFADSRHELYRSKDKSRKRWISELISFFDKISNEAKKQSEK